MSAKPSVASPASTFVVAMSERFGLDQDALFETLGKTAFKQSGGGRPSDVQMTALMIVANEYNLNPFTKEIYAFPDKNGGIVPVVGVDGWVTIINSQKQYQGLEFRYSEKYVTMPGTLIPAPDWIECWIYRKDLDQPIKVREFLDETYRFFPTNPGAWQSHPKRMLRHKALIQAARIAFGLSGIYDDDEADRILEAQPDDRSITSNVVQLTAQRSANNASLTAIPHLTDEEQATFAKELAELIQRGKQLGSFAPCRAWVDSLDNPAAKNYLHEELAAAEQTWLTRVAEPTTEPETANSSIPHAEPLSSDNDSGANHEEDKQKADLRTTVKQLIDQCLAVNNFEPGHAWIKARLSHSKTATDYALEQLEAAESQWKLDIAS